jgi:hypothetical protein
MHVAERRRTYLIQERLWRSLRGHVIAPKVDRLFLQPGSTHAKTLNRVADGLLARRSVVRLLAHLDIATDVD